MEPLLPLAEEPPVPDVVIRPEHPDDHAEIATVVTAAFESPQEADLVAAIRDSDGYVPDLALVAEVDAKVVGHVMISRVGLEDGDSLRQILSLAPIGVAPEFQRRGIGGQLVRAATAKADDLGAPLVVLEGSPYYYQRFGFEHSVPFGIHFDLPDWAPPEAAQVLRLSAYDPNIKGRLVYPPAFQAVEGG